MLALKPELVDMKHAQGVVPTLPEEVSLKWTFDELTPYAAPAIQPKLLGKKVKE